LGEIEWIETLQHDFFPVEADQPSLPCRNNSRRAVNQVSKCVGVCR